MKELPLFAAVNSVVTAVDQKASEQNKNESIYFQKCRLETAKEPSASAQHSKISSMVVSFLSPSVGPETGNKIIFLF